jgi:hypothetical protein
MNYTRQKQSLQSNFSYGFNVLDDDEDDDTNNVIFTRSKSIVRNPSTVPVKF